MSSLKALKLRIKTAKSSQKITKAMKMVAASKLKKVRDKAESTERYASKLDHIVRDIAESRGSSLGDYPLLNGNGRDNTYLLIVATSDRGLCGSFNSSIVKAAKRKTRELLAEGKQVRILCVGKKSFDQMKADFMDHIVHRIDGISRKPISYKSAEDIYAYLFNSYDLKEFDICLLFYNKFISTISQKVMTSQLIPLSLAENVNKSGSKTAANSNETPYEYEPNPEEILAELLPLNIKMQVYQALLENAASEQGARVTAMDNATRNAGEMIGRLTLDYNRKRQANITKELIEIISGAEAI